MENLLSVLLSQSSMNGSKVMELGLAGCVAMHTYPALPYVLDSGSLE